MISGYEVDFADYVKVGDKIYFVFSVDFQNKTADLVPVELLDKYSDDEDRLRENSSTFYYRQISKLEPVKVDEATLRSFFRMDVMPWQLVIQGKYPFSSATAKFNATEEDILCLIENIYNKSNSIALVAWNENFSTIEFNSLVRLPKKSEPGFTFKFLCEELIKFLGWFDPDEDLDEMDYVYELRDFYLEAKEKSLKELELPNYLKRNILDDIEKYSKYNSISDELKDYYINSMEELCKTYDRHELTRKAYAYYGGNKIVPCDWKKSEEALLLLYEKYNDEFAANSLGYIYYSDRLGEPDHEKAFEYFSFASRHRVIEATYKLSDMYRKGHGTEKSPQTAWELISILYDLSDKKHKSERKYPDIALRMGYCYRDGIGVKKDLDKALEFFYEAKEGIEFRIKKNCGFGDEVVLKNIIKAINSIKNGK